MLQVVQKVVDILLLFLIKEVRIAQEFSQVAAVQLKVLRIEETLGQDLGGI